MLELAYIRILCLCDGIKFVVIARAEEIKQVYDVPRSGSDGHKYALKYVYGYMRSSKKSLPGFRCLVDWSGLLQH
jgi:hypothetical protein